MNLTREEWLVMTDAVERHLDYLTDCNLPKTREIAANGLRKLVDIEPGSPYQSVETAAEAIRRADAQKVVATLPVTNDDF